MTFAGPAPELAPIPGVRATRTGPDAVRYEVRGLAGALIDALAGHQVASIDSREASLEEIFLHHYDGAGDRARP